MIFIIKTMNSIIEVIKYEDRGSEPKNSKLVQQRSKNTHKCMYRLPWHGVQSWMREKQQQAYQCSRILPSWCTQPNAANHNPSLPLQSKPMCSFNEDINQHHYIKCYIVMNSTKPDNIPWTKSHNMETTRKGVIEANALIITGLLLNKLAQRLWPNDSARTTASASTTVSLRVTRMACLARSGCPAPNSLDTLVLQE